MLADWTEPLTSYVCVDIFTPVGVAATTRLVNSNAPQLMMVISRHGEYS